MNPVRFFAKEFTKAKYKYLNRSIIENIDTDLFNEILKQFLDSGWLKIYEYEAVDAWIDFGKVKIKKDKTVLTFEWDNYMEGVIIGNKSEIDQVAKQFCLQSSSVPSYISEST
jgi:reverse gyrase